MTRPIPFSSFVCPDCGADLDNYLRCTNEDCDYEYDMGCLEDEDDCE